MKLYTVIYLILLFIFIGCSEESMQKNEYTPLSEQDTEKLSKDITALQQDTTTVNDSLIVKFNQLLLKYPSSKADVSEKIAHAFYRKSNFYLTKLYFEKSAHEFLKDSMQLRYAEQLTNIGVLNELMGDYPKAIDNYYDALTIFKKEKLELKSSFVYNNLGIVYQQLKERDKSISLYKKSLQITESINRLDLSASRYNNLASVYEEFDANLDSALFYYQKALEIISKDSLNTSFPVVKSNVANIYIQKNELNKADSILDEALAYSKLNNISIGRSTIYKVKSELLIKKENFQLAEEYIDKAIISMKKSNYKKGELESLAILISCLEKQHKFQEALIKLKEYNELKSSMAGIEQRKEINNLNIRYNVQQKDNEIKLLQVQKEETIKRAEISYFVFALIILILIISIYIVNLKRKHSNLLVKQKQRDISDYINQIHNFEEEIHEKEENQHELFLQKVKQFDLTEREEEVLLYISKGYKNTEIAEKMFVSINTTKTHIKNIFIKLDVRNRIEAANKAKV